VPNKGFRHSAESKAQMSRSRMGRKLPAFSEEWKANMSVAKKGIPQPRVFEIGCKFLFRNKSRQDGEGSA
jgi:hypothetical protein